MTLPGPMTLRLAPLPTKTPCNELPTANVPVASVPIRLPETVFPVELAFWILIPAASSPAEPLPEMRLPLIEFIVASVRRIPSSPLGTVAVPEALVPM